MRLWKHGKRPLFLKRYIFQGRMRQAQNSFVFDSFSFSSGVEPCRTLVVAENYLLLAAFVEFLINDKILAI